MITFDLECDNGHRFEGWFKNREDFDGQLSSSAIACPLCESVKIRKLPSKAAVHVQKNHLPQNLQSKVEALSYYRALGDFVEKNFEYVGESFAEEAKKMKNDEAPARSIRGITTPAEEEALTDEGIEFFKVALPKYDA
ncbi:DUF1178 family protein [bacterium]|nr:MAG: DUF1178 family protein [bacterium]